MKINCKRIWFLFGLSFLMHCIVVLLIGHYKQPVLWENGMIADYLFSGRGFCGDFSVIGEPTSWQAPAYPYLLFWTWKLFGKGVAAYLFISFLQCLALASMLWPVTALSRRWFPRVPELIVQVLVLFAPLYLWYGTRLHHTAFVMAFQPWVLWGWLVWARRSFPGALSVGVGTGLVSLIQPVILAVFGIIGIALLVTTLASRTWIQSLCLVCAGMAVLLTLTPWTLRNYKTQGRLLLIKDSFGKEFWMGNNPHATGTGYAIGGTEEITNLYPPECFSKRGLIREMDLMDAMGSEAASWISLHPVQFLKLTACKLWWMWTVPPKDRVRSTGAAEAILFRSVYLFYWAGILGLSVVGMTRSRPAREYGYVLLVFVLLYSLVYGLTHVGQARFRGEIEYIFFPAAAAGIFSLWGMLLSFRDKPLKQ